MDNEASPQKKNSGSNKLQLPLQPRKRHPSINRSDVQGKDGFIVNKDERDYFAQQFQNDTSLQILNKNDAYSVPPGHPLYGKIIPFDIMKDNNGNIFAIHDGAKLGKGAFGNVVTIQCLQGQTPSMVGEYYALKVQKPEDKEELNNIKKEMQIAGKFDLMVGELEIQRGGKTVYFTVMPLLGGKELAKNTTSYEGYEAKPIVIDSDKKAVREELGKGIQSLLWEEQPPTPRTPPVINLNVPTSMPQSNSSNSNNSVKSGSQVIKQTEPSSNSSMQYSSQVIIKEPESNSNNSVKSGSQVVKQTEPSPNSSMQYSSQVIIKEPESNSNNSVKSGSQVVKQTEPSPNSSMQYSSQVIIKEPESNPNSSVKSGTQVKKTDVDSNDSVQQSNVAASTVKVSEKATTPPVEPIISEKKPPVTTMTGDPKSFEVERWLALYQKMASEIERCHAEGVLHLDIKPENFMHDPKTGTVKMIDFGLSLRINEVGNKTPTDLCQGTPGYMAPEFFKFSFQEAISTKQDIYALGRSFDLLFYQQMAKMVGYNFTFRSELDAGAVLKKGELYVGRDTGQFNYTVMTLEGKWVTENLPRDFPIQYLNAYGWEVNTILEKMPPEEKMTDSMRQALALGIAQYAIDKGHLSAVPFPYLPSLPPGIKSTDLPRHFPKNSLITNHFKDFRIENKENDPRITAMNGMIELVHSMQNPNVAMRPEASVVRLQLAAIQTRLQQQVEEKAILKQIIRDAPQQKTGILQLRAISMLIKKHNQDAIQKWEKQPEQNRGPKPLEIKISSLDAIKTLIQEVQNDIAKEKQQQVDNIASKKAREEYEKNHAANDYQLYKEIRLDLTKEINQLMIKRKGMTGAEPSELAHIDKMLESKQLQLKNAEVEIRTYERKHLSEFELKTNPLSAFAHMVQDIDKEQKQTQKNNHVIVAKEIVGHTDPAPVMFEDVNHHPHHHANNQATYKQQVNVAPLQQAQQVPAAATVATVAKNPEIEAIKVELKSFRDKLSNYKLHTDASAQHQQASMLGSALNFLGKVDKNDKSALAQNLMNRIDGLLKNADEYGKPYKTSDELNRKFLAVCQDGIDANIKIHKGKISAAEKSDLYDICNDTKKTLTSQQHLRQKK